MSYDFVLCVSDLHAPYGHPDTVSFLRAIKDKYWSKAKKPCCVLMGDEADFHSLSFHDHSPELMSPSDELKTAINRLSPLYKLFPKAYILESNHGSMVYRKQSHHGIPRHVIKSYRDILGAPKDWHWVKDLTLKMSDGRQVYFHHGKSADVTKLSQAMSMSAVQGHFHEKFKIEYWANPNGLFWAMQTGCLIEDDSLAFAYNRNNLKRPLIGTGVIVNGQPKLIAMILNSKGRWIRELR